MKYFSLFSGIGGFELGIQQAYVDTINRSENRGKQKNSSKDDEKRARLVPKKGKGARITEGLLGEHVEHEHHGGEPHCVGYSEIDKYAIQVYQKHFPNHTNYGDITKINEKELPDFDLLVGGFPCQAFSIAGKRRGFEDTRGTLFFEIARILKTKRPRLVLLENVKGLLSHDSGRTFFTIISTLDELGYDLQWQVLNSKNHGVPQNRERVFIVGHLRGTARPKVFPIGEDNQRVSIEGQGIQRPFSTETERRQNGELCDSEVFQNGLYGQLHQLNQPTHSNDRVYGSDGIAPTLNTMQGGRRQPKVYIPEATRGGYSIAEKGDSINLAVPNSKTRRGRVGKRIAQTLDTGMQQHTLTSDMRIRRLTPVECCRLQGFYDYWTKYGLVYLTPEEYNRDYANAKKNNPIEVLQSLQEAIIKGEGEGRRFAKHFTLLKKKILQSGLYEKGVFTSLERQSASTSREMESEAVGHCDRMWEMWLDEASRYSPQRQKLVEQFFVQLRGHLSEMSCKGAPKAKIVVISDTQRYKCCGNAVTTNVIRDIVVHLI